MLGALVSSALTVLGLLAVMWLVTQMGAHRPPPSWGEVLATGLGEAPHLPVWTLWLVLTLAGALFARYVVLEAARWLWLIPRMAHERVAYAVLPPASFAPSAEAIAAFTADLLGMRRRVLAWLDREATALVVGLTTTDEGRPLMYWELPRRFEKELEAARSFYPGLRLVPLATLRASVPPVGAKTVSRRLELRPGRPERFPLQAIHEQTDALQAFAGVLSTVRVDAGQRLEQRTYILPVAPSLLARVRRSLVTVARTQEFGDPLASVQTMSDRFNPAEAVERRIERQGLWAKVGKAEPMFRVQVLVQAVAPADARGWPGYRSEAAAGLVKAVFGAWEQWAGQNYLRSVGWPVLGGLAMLFGSNSWLRRSWFDYRWRTGTMGHGKVWTSWELWPLLKPWTRFCRGRRILRRLGIELSPPDEVPEDGMLICVSG
jgi:hypothetical protein